MTIKYYVKKSSGGYCPTFCVVDVTRETEINFWCTNWKGYRRKSAPSSMLFDVFDVAKKYYIVSCEILVNVRQHKFNSAKQQLEEARSMKSSSAIERLGNFKEMIVSLKQMVDKIQGEIDAIPDGEEESAKYEFDRLIVARDSLEDALTGLEKTREFS